MTKPHAPPHTDVVKLRRKVQHQFKLRSDLAGKTLCAEVVFVGPSVWARWETDEAAMHPAFWELANIKLDQILSECGPLYAQWLPRIIELQTRKRRGPDSEQARINREKRKELGLC